jgi:hypothetical protein
MESFAGWSNRWVEPDHSSWSVINPGGLLLMGMFLESLTDVTGLLQPGRQLDSVRMQTLRNHGCEGTNGNDPGGKDGGYPNG